MIAMVGSIYLFITTESRKLDEISENVELREEFWGKIAIVIFTIVGTVAFVILQVGWYRKFFEKLARTNRDIEVEIDNHKKKTTLSTICESLLCFMW